MFLIIEKNKLKTHSWTYQQRWRCTCYNTRGEEVRKDLACKDHLLHAVVLIKRKRCLSPSEFIQFAFNWVLNTGIITAVKIPSRSNIEIHPEPFRLCAVFCKVVNRSRFSFNLTPTFCLCVFCWLVSNFVFNNFSTSHLTGLLEHCLKLEEPITDAGRLKAA